MSFVVEERSDLQLKSLTSEFPSFHPHITSKKKLCQADTQRGGRQNLALPSDGV